MKTNFQIANWAAWVPGINHKEDWREHFQNPPELDLSQKPDVSFLPAMFRRKLSPLNRMIFATVNQLQDQNSLSSLPIVFSSQHGELDLSLKLIDSAIEKRPMSPAGFSMSVHNSPTGLLSIHYGNRQSMTAVSAGKGSLKMGLIEALSQLKEHEKLIYIYADMCLPKVYEKFESANDYPCCLAMILGKGSLPVTPPDSCNFEDILRILVKSSFTSPLHGLL